MCVPFGGAVLCFGNVVYSLTVAGEEEELVGCVFRGCGIKVGEVGGEKMPLGLWGVG